MVTQKCLHALLHTQPEINVTLNKHLGQLKFFGVSVLYTGGIFGNGPEIMKMAKEKWNEPAGPRVRPIDR